MHLTFTKVLYPDNYLTKPFYGTPLEIEWKANTEIDPVHPCFRIATVAELKAYNYCVCSELARNYFIRRIEVYRTDVYDVYCECDVLTTYATYIRNCHAYVHHGSYGNLYANDRFSNYDVRKNIRQTYTFDNPFTDGTFILVGVKGERNIN